MKLRIKKSSRTFYDTRTHFATLARACFHESHVWDKSLCEYAAHVSKNASHIATLALDVHSQGHWGFFFEGHRRPSSRDRVINAPCVSSAPRFLAARAGLHFVRFYWVLLRVVFSSFFDLLNNFFVIYIITNTSLTPSHHQNFLSTRHEIVKTRQYTKNGQKWLFLRVSKKRFKMGVFGLFFDLIEKSRFFDINTSSTHQKMRL
jgi:hypothetical protein